MHVYTGLLLGLSFIFLAIYFSIDVPFSAVFKYSRSYSDRMKIAESKNRARLKKSLHYIYTRDEPMQKMPRLSEADDIDLLIVIVTVSREKYSREEKNGYLFQTATSMDKLMKSDEYFKKKAMVICNVNDDPEKHGDAVELQSYLPFINKGGGNNLGFNVTVIPELQNCGLTDDARRKELIDYAFCLNVSHSIRHQYALFLEDDVIPYENLFKVLHHTLKYRHKRNKQFSFLKLYYPIRWQGYAFEIDRILELISFGTLGGALFSILAWYFEYDLPRKRKVKSNIGPFFIMGFLSFLIVAKIIGRMQVLELRRITPHLSKLGPSPESCTQAMLYKRETLQDLIRHLLVNNSLNKDLAISDFAKKQGSSGYSLEPNLFAHTGMRTSFSSESKDPEEFLFNMPFLE
ncbi:post-GPI attachment to proteins factor 4-like [Ruditapes philippinarum]|uniref:post-GPI attachment to proteins factor 4-like n=1 Tax=Ruditapes philippinarum TaxID=129788 RepID=UPI00295AEB34|nr:post-GPI attachment to proteins factor 4-like [Ruditapes philippinarum]